MRNEIFFAERVECRQCSETTKSLFRYVEGRRGERTEFIVKEAYALVFVLSGKVLISCNEFYEVLISSPTLFILPISAQCVWENLEDATGVILSGDSEYEICDRVALESHIECFMPRRPEFTKLKIHPRMLQFLKSVCYYLQDDISCPRMHRIKQRELALLFRAYYHAEDVVTLFSSVIQDSSEFKQFIMKNYLKMKGVKEFVDLSGLSLSAFNRKFKAHFGESPYQWMIKQKSKHILHELLTKNKSISEVMKTYDFVDASHFNRYCKAMFGAPPSKLKKMHKYDIGWILHNQE